MEGQLGNPETDKAVYFTLVRKVDAIDLDYLIFNKAFCHSPLGFYWLYVPFLVVGICGRATPNRLDVTLVSHQVSCGMSQGFSFDPIVFVHSFIRTSKSLLSKFSDNTEFEKVVTVKDYRIPLKLFLCFYALECCSKPPRWGWIGLSQCRTDVHLWKVYSASLG